MDTDKRTRTHRLHFIVLAVAAIISVSACFYAVTAPVDGVRQPAALDLSMRPQQITDAHDGDSDDAAAAITGIKKAILAASMRGIKPPVFAFDQGSTTIMLATTSVVAASAPAFEYAHGIVIADGKFFIGTVRGYGNPFPTNRIMVFDTPGDITRITYVPLPNKGEAQNMVYDSTHDKIYFLISGNNDLELYGLDPVTYALQRIIRTTAINTGSRPAIVTDGTYVYGITNTATSTVFKVRIDTGELSFSSGHIATGHSAAIGIYASTTELYFGGGISNGFEKVDAATLKSLGSLDTGTCLPTNDMAYAQIDDTSGYAYLGCELVPYGYRVRTSDLSATRFPLPGNSLGLFIYNGSLYNTAEDGHIDVFPGLDLSYMVRYLITGLPAFVNTAHQAIEPNELFYSPDTNSFYFTAWWGVPGLFSIKGL